MKFVCAFKYLSTQCRFGSVKWRRPCTIVFAQKSLAVVESNLRNLANFGGSLFDRLGWFLFDWLADGSDWFSSDKPAEGPGWFSLDRLAERRKRTTLNRGSRVFLQIYWRIDFIPERNQLTDCSLFTGLAETAGLSCRAMVRNHKLKRRFNVELSQNYLLLFKWQNFTDRRTFANEHNFNFFEFLAENSSLRVSHTFKETECLQNHLHISE